MPVNKRIYSLVKLLLNNHWITILSNLEWAWVSHKPFTKEIIFSLVLPPKIWYFRKFSSIPSVLLTFPRWDKCLKSLFVVFNMHNRYVYVQRNTRRLVILIISLCYIKYILGQCTWEHGLFCDWIIKYLVMLIRYIHSAPWTPALISPSPLPELQWSRTPLPSYG